jgi:predicted aldo/keto reductase-like oxidoreductase
VQQLEAKLAEKDAKEELERRRQSLMKRGLIDSEDDIQEVEKVMLEKGITNHETAAEYHQWMKEAAKPTPSGYNPQVIQKFDLSQYWKNPVSAARNEAAKALNDLRKRNRPIGL